MLHKLLIAVLLLESYILATADGEGANECGDKDGVQLNPAATDCASYIVCKNGTSEVFQCPEGLLFNPFKSTCDYDTSVKCEDGEAVQIVETRISVPSTDVECETDTCTCVYPSQYSCSEYYRCENGVAYKEQCPAGLALNTKKLTCDYEENVDCSITTVTQNTESTRVVAVMTSTLSESEDNNMNASFIDDTTETNDDQSTSTLSTTDSFEESTLATTDGEELTSETSTEFPSSTFTSVTSTMEESSYSSESTDSTPKESSVPFTVNPSESSLSTSATGISSENGDLTFSSSLTPHDSTHDLNSRSPMTSSESVTTEEDASVSSHLTPEESTFNENSLLNTINPGTTTSEDIMATNTALNVSTLSPQTEATYQTHATKPSTDQVNNISTDISTDEMSVSTETTENILSTGSKIPESLEGISNTDTTISELSTMESVNMDIVSSNADEILTTQHQDNETTDFHSESSLVSAEDINFPLTSTNTSDKELTSTTPTTISSTIKYITDFFSNEATSDFRSEPSFVSTENTNSPLNTTNNSDKELTSIIQTTISQTTKYITDLFSSEAPDTVSTNSDSEVDISTVSDIKNTTAIMNETTIENVNSNVDMTSTTNSNVDEEISFSTLTNGMSSDTPQNDFTTLDTIIPETTTDSNYDDEGSEDSVISISSGDPIAYTLSSAGSSVGELSVSNTITAEKESISASAWPDESLTITSIHTPTDSTLSQSNETTISTEMSHEEHILTDVSSDDSSVTSFPSTTYLPSKSTEYYETTKEHDVSSLSSNNANVSDEQSFETSSHSSVFSVSTSYEDNESPVNTIFRETTTVHSTIFSTVSDIPSSDATDISKETSQNSMVTFDNISDTTLSYPRSSAMIPEHTSYLPVTPNNQTFNESTESMALSEEESSFSDLLASASDDSETIVSSDANIFSPSASQQTTASDSIDSTTSFSPSENSASSISINNEDTTTMSSLSDISTVFISTAPDVSVDHTLSNTKLPFDNSSDKTTLESTSTETAQLSSDPLVDSTSMSANNDDLNELFSDESSNLFSTVESTSHVFSNEPVYFSTISDKTISTTSEAPQKVTSDLPDFSTQNQFIDTSTSTDKSGIAEITQAPIASTNQYGITDSTSSNDLVAEQDVITTDSNTVSGDSTNLKGSTIMKETTTIYDSTELLTSPLSYSVADELTTDYTTISTKDSSSDYTFTTDPSLSHDPTTQKEPSSYISNISEDSSSPDILTSEETSLLDITTSSEGATKTNLTTLLEELSSENSATTSKELYSSDATTTEIQPSLHTVKTSVPLFTKEHPTTLEQFSSSEATTNSKVSSSPDAITSELTFSSSDITLSEESTISEVTAIAEDSSSSQTENTSEVPNLSEFPSTLEEKLSSKATVIAEYSSTTEHTTTSEHSLIDVTNTPDLSSSSEDATISENLTFSPAETVSDVPTTSEVITSSDVPTTSEVITSSDVPTTSEVITSSDIQTTSDGITSPHFSTTSEMIISPDATTVREESISSDTTTTAKVPVRANVTTAQEIHTFSDTATTREVSYTYDDVTKQENDTTFDVATTSELPTSSSEIISEVFNFSDEETASTAPSSSEMHTLLDIASTSEAPAQSDDITDLEISTSSNAATIPEVPTSLDDKYPSSSPFPLDTSSKLESVSPIDQTTSPKTTSLVSSTYSEPLGNLETASSENVNISISTSTENILPSDTSVLMTSSKDIVSVTDTSEFESVSDESFSFTPTNIIELSSDNDINFFSNDISKTSTERASSDFSDSFISTEEHAISSTSYDKATNPTESSYVPTDFETTSGETSPVTSGKLTTESSSEPDHIAFTSSLYPTDSVTSTYLDEFTHSSVLSTETTSSIEDKLTSLSSIFDESFSSDSTLSLISKTSVTEPSHESLPTDNSRVSKSLTDDELTKPTSTSSFSSIQTIPTSPVTNNEAISDTGTTAVSTNSDILVEDTPSESNEYTSSLHKTESTTAISEISNIADSKSTEHSFTSLLTETSFATETPYSTISMSSMEPLSETTKSVSTSTLSPSCDCENCKLEDSEDCTRYYECQNGELVSKQCPIGYLFNGLIKECDHSPNLSCNSKSDLCVNGDGFYADPKNCSSYVLCYGGIPYKRTCSAGLMYNPSMRTCDTSFNCGAEPQKPIARNYEVDCECDNCALPDSDDCSKYYLCLNNTAYEMHCSEGLHFNPDQLTCDYASSVSCAEYSSQCLEMNGFFPVLGNCSRYYHCVGGVAHEKQCEGNKHFSISTDGCEEPCEAECDTSLDCTTSATVSLANVCEEPDGFFPHPTSCKKFIKCKDGHPTIAECIENEHFNPIDKFCQEPCEAMCDSSLDCVTFASDSTDSEELSTISVSEETSTPTATQVEHDSSTFEDIFSLSESTTDEAVSQTSTTTISTVPISTETVTNEDPFTSFDRITETESTSTYATSPGISRASKSMKDESSVEDSTTSLTDAHTATEVTEPEYFSTVLSRNESTAEPDNCDKGNGVYPKHGDCTSLIACILGNKMELHCPRGLHFSAYSKKCEEPCEAMCDTTLDCLNPDETESSSPLPVTFCPVKDFLPKKGFCNYFYNCTDGIRKKIKCPRGLHFNPTSRVCDFPSRANCGDPPGRLYWPDRFKKCPCETCLLPSTVSCSDYYLCLNRTAYPMSCSRGLLFDKRTNTCNYGSETPCDIVHTTTTTTTTTRRPTRTTTTKKQSTPTSTKATSTPITRPTTQATRSPTTSTTTKATRSPITRTTTKATRTPITSTTTKATQPTKSTKRPASSSTTTTLAPRRYRCLARNGLFRNPYKCGSFIQCLNWWPHVKACPGSLHFNNATKRCENPCDAKCDKSLNCATTTEPTDTDSTSDPICTCRNCLLPSEESCTKYIECKHGKATKRVCRRGQTFDSERKTCDWAHRVDCRHSEICLRRNGLFPYKHDCTKFVHCANGIPYIKTCPSNLHFDPEKLRCEWPSDKCVPEGDVKGLIPHETDWKCPTPYGYFRSDKSCNEFYICIDNKPHPRRCSKNLVFNSIKRVCDWPEDTNCHGIQNYPQKRCRFYDSDVQCHRNRTNLIHPDCDSFYDCTTGRPCRKRCPEGLLYNSNSDTCDEPQNVSCKKRDGSSYNLKIFTDMCRYKRRGHMTDPADATCFYRCQNSRVFRGCCSRNRVFDQRRNRCIWRYY